MFGAESFVGTCHEAGLNVTGYVEHITSSKFFEGYTHTDCIVEDPMRGRSPLTEYIIKVVTGKEEQTRTDLVYPTFLVNWASRINPF